VRAVLVYVRLAPFLAFCLATPAFSQDAREIVRKSVELDQANWLRMSDYTWLARSHERHFDARGKIASEREEAWETIILDGQPYRRIVERDGRPLPAAEERKEQQRLDTAAAKLESETPEQKKRHSAEYQKSRQREFEFLREIPDAFECRLEGDAKVDGRDVWVISGVPNPRYHPKTADAKARLKISGKMWVDKSDYQWVRVEAESKETISFGLFLAWLNPGAKMVFEQTRINNEMWLPKRLFLSGNGRVGLVKRVAEDQEITWNDYKKFQVESKVVPREQ
jgi:hypothetical protein